MAETPKDTTDPPMPPPMSNPPTDAEMEADRRYALSVRNDLRAQANAHHGVTPPLIEPNPPFGIVKGPK